MSDQPVRKADSKKFRVSTDPPAPDYCRARLLAQPDLVRCMIEVPTRCRHSDGFAGYYFCTHPRRVQLAEISKSQSSGKRRAVK
jgi:hypothetical protein